MFKNKWKRRYIQLRQNYNKLREDHERARKTWYSTLEMIDAQLDLRKHQVHEYNELERILSLYKEKYGELEFGGK